MSATALTVGELSVSLELDHDRFRQQLDNAKRALEGLPPAAQREFVKVTRVADREGRAAGGKLAQGLNQGLIRASPLIVAGVSGALAAGAPAVLAGASLMFAGVGIAAAAQNDEVRAAFAGVRDVVLDEVDAIGQPFADVLPGIADQIGAAFLRMEPQIIGAVSAVVPHIEGLTDSALAMAENALPGMVRAAENAGPVMAGLGSFLETAGTAVGEFFGGLSEHGPAAGQALASLGDIVGSLVPTLGVFLGQGAELAATVLPPLASALGLVADVAQDLGPVLPAIAAGLAALKIGGVVSGGMQSLSGRLATVAQNAAFATYELGGMDRRGMSVASAGASRMSRAVAGIGEGVGKLGAVLPGVGVLMAMFAAKMAEAEQAEQRWATGLLEGGAAADAAAAQAEEASGRYTDSWVGSLSRTLDEWAGITPTIDDARAANDEYLATLTPLERAQALATQAQNNYTDAVARHGQESPQAKAALTAYNDASNEAERQAGQTEMALSGVTQAMVDQANQALAAIDSSFGYQNSLNQLEDAQTAVNDALKEHGPNSEEAQRAQLGLEEQSYRTALAFGQQQADMSGAAEGSAEYARIMQETALQELYRLRDAAGPQLAGALNQQIAMLEASGVSLQGTSAETRQTADRMRDLASGVREVPGFKGVTINAPTEDQRRRIQDLGYRVETLPDGSVYVVADTADAEREIAWLTRVRRAQIQMTVAMQGRQTTGAFAATGGALEGGRFHRYQVGGAVFGAGGPTDDRVPALGPDRNARYRLSNGEHIITAAEVRAAGGHTAVADWRRSVLAQPRGYANGGPVTDTTTAGPDRRPLFHADRIELVRGDPQEVARILSLEARTGR